MKKRRIRYSELPSRETPGESHRKTPAEVFRQAPIEAPPPRRVSTPVELARALAAAREAELRDAEERRRAEAAVAAAPKPQAAPNVATPVPSNDAALAELLLFSLGSERFAVPMGDVEEAVDLPAVHFVPEMPPAMLGVISLRGSLVPVYSPEGPLGQSLVSRTSALIFRLDGRRAGVVVDDVEDALVVAEDEMREMPASEHGDLILGVVQHQGSLIAVMRAASLVAACRDARVMTTV